MNYETAPCNRCGLLVPVTQGQVVLSCYPIFTPYTKKNQDTKIERYTHGLGRASNTDPVQHLIVRTCPECGCIYDPNSTLAKLSRTGWCHRTNSPCGDCHGVVLGGEPNQD